MRKMAGSRPLLEPILMLATILTVRPSNSNCALRRVSVRARGRACVRVCVRACARACVRARVLTYGQRARPTACVSLHRASACMHACVPACLRARASVMPCGGCATVSYTTAQQPTYDGNNIFITIYVQYLYYNMYNIFITIYVF